MAYTDEKTGLEVVTLAECVRYLETKEVGRLAFNVDGHIHLYPVNYVWDGEAIVFRTEPDSPFARTPDTEVVLEIDHIDVRTRTGWSVVARGYPKRIDPEKTPELQQRLQRLALYPWAGGDKGVWLRVIPAPLTGRRVERSTIL